MLTKHFGHRACKTFLFSALVLLSAAFLQNRAAVAGERHSTMQTSEHIEQNPVTIPAIDRQAPAKFATATFGLGWFWGIESRFGIIEGVIRTRVGYAGGGKERPDYHNLGDHTEAVQVDYDPKRISYERLLEIFWNSHTPNSRSWSTQYKNAIFYHDKTQRQAGEDSRAALAEKNGRTVHTGVVPLRSFNLAENYHQKYLLKQQSDLAAEMTRIYPLKRDFIDSTAAARLNGYVGGNGDFGQLSREIDRLGLSARGRQILEALVR